MGSTMSLMARLFGSPPADPPKLSHDHALRLARLAAEESADELVARGAWRDDRGMAWHFWTATKGSGATVRVDDDTSQAGVHRWGLR